MNNLDMLIENDVLNRNKIRMSVFLSVFIFLHTANYLIILKNPAMLGYQASDAFNILMPLLISSGIIILILNLKFAYALKSILGYVFILFAATTNLVYVACHDLTGLGLVTYICIYLVVASIFYYSYELIVASVITQLILFLILKITSIETNQIINIMSVSTFIILLSWHIGFNNLINHRRILNSEQQMLDGHSLLQGMLSRIDTFVILMNLKGEITYINETFRKIAGISGDNYNNLNINLLFTGTSLEPIIKAFENVVETKKPYTIEKHISIEKDSREYSLRISMDYIELNNDSYIIIAANDRTKEVHLSKVKDIVIRLNNMLSEYHSLDDYFDDILRSLVETIPYVKLGSILLADEQGLMTMRANVGYDRSKADKFKLHIKETFYYRNCGENYNKPVIINDIPSYPMDGITDVLDNNYGNVVASSLCSPIIIDGKFQGLLNLDSFENHVFNNEDLEIMQFLTEQISLVLTSHKLLNQTIYLSKYDQLTGLYNRWMLNEVESTAIPHSLRYEEHFFFVMMDVNNLKNVNDNYGHVLGDEYLVEFSNMLKNHFRVTDILIRIGGDEFVGIFFAIDEQLLHSKMQEINQKLETRMISLGVNFKCNFAYGIAAFPEERQTMMDLMKLSDERMYHKKLEMKGYTV